MSTFVYMTRCDGCGHCVDICPSDIMHIDENIRRAKNIEPNYNLIKNIASECQMPICYGGGIRNISQIEKIVSLGVEKIAISNAYFTKKNIIYDAAKIVGSQSVVVVIDVKKSERISCEYDIYIKNGLKKCDRILLDVIQEIQELGCGEIIINSIDRDGTRKGYDFELISKIIDYVSVPLTVLGGVGSYDDIKNLFRKFGVLGASAGSVFVFKGKFRAVLLQYPDESTKESLYHY